MNSGDYLIPKEIYDELFSDYIELVQKEEQLQQENARLKDKIEKVIEYIENNKDTCYMDDDINYLLRILKEN